MNTSVIDELQCLVNEFGLKRNWKKFHSPKNLAMALAVESSELLELFQWMSDAESKSPESHVVEKAGLELADIFMYALLLSQELGVDLEECTRKKMKLNEARFPV